MGKVLFKIRYLGLGGIERLTIDILNNINLKDKKIVLMLEERNELFKGQLPKELEIVYIKSEKLQRILEYLQKNKKGNVFYKILFELLMNYEKIHMANNINKYIEENKNIKIFIDYSGSATKYIDKIKCKYKIYWSHLGLGNISESKRKRLLKRLNNYDYIIAICKEMERELKDNFKEISSKIKMIYNFIDENKIEKKLNEDKKLQEELSKERYCVSVGRLTEPKDYETTIKAFKILKEKGIKEKLFIIGDGRLKEKLNDLIKSEHLEEQVFLLGAKDNPYIYMKYADLFLHSSNLEGFPMVFLESMYIDTPIISSNFKTGACELIEKEKNGEIFKIGNYKEFADKIEKLLSDEKLRKEYSEKSKKFVKKFYIENILKEYEKLIESLN